MVAVFPFRTCTLLSLADFSKQCPPGFCQCRDSLESSNKSTVSFCWLHPGGLVCYVIPFCWFLLLFVLALKARPWTLLCLEEGPSLQMSSLRALVNRPVLPVSESCRQSAGSVWPRFSLSSSCWLKVVFLNRFSLQMKTEASQLYLSLTALICQWLSVSENRF